MSFCFRGRGRDHEALPDETQLPLTDEALRAFFRKQRHELLAGEGS